MQRDDEGGPEQRTSSTRRSRSSMVMPAVDPCETTFVTVKMDTNFSFDSPDHHEAPTTPTAHWSIQENSSKADLSAFPPHDACSDSSSMCAEEKHDHRCSESRSCLNRGDRDTIGGVDDGKLDGSGSEERMAAQVCALSETNVRLSSPVQVLIIMLAATTASQCTAYIYIALVSFHSRYSSALQCFLLCFEHDPTTGQSDQYVTFVFHPCVSNTSLCNSSS